jgi:hypothetical protein
VFGAGGALTAAMENDDQRNGLAVVIGGRNVDEIAPIASAEFERDGFRARPRRASKDSAHGDCAQKRDGEGRYGEEF